MIQNNIIRRVLIMSLVILATSSIQALNTDSLTHYLKIAAEHNPGVKSSFLAYKAAVEKAPQAGAYEDPELEIGFFLEPMDVLGGRQVADFKLMQMFPWFGTKGAAKTEAVHRAKVAFEQFREAKDELYLEVYTQWYLLSSLQQQLVNNTENVKLLQKLEDLSAKKQTASLSTMSDVLRIQLEIVELENNIESINSQIKAEKAKFNTLLNRSINQELQIPDSIQKVEFLFDEAMAVTTMINHNPTLGMITEEGLAYKAKAKMDKKMSYPMFGIGVQYMLNKKTNDPMFAMGSMNGKDMIMPMVSVSIPIYRNKYKAQQRESKLWMESSKENYTNTLNSLQSELYKSKHQLDDASRKVTLYNKQEDIAKTAYNLIVQEFVSGKSDLTNVIQVQRQLLDYQLKKAEATAEYNTMVASTQKLISFQVIGE